MLQEFTPDLSILGSFIIIIFFFCPSYLYPTDRDRSTTEWRSPKLIHPFFNLPFSISYNYLILTFGSFRFPSLIRAAKIIITVCSILALILVEKSLKSKFMASSQLINEETLRF